MYTDISPHFLLKSNQIHHLVPWHIINSRLRKLSYHEKDYFVTEIKTKIRIVTQPCNHSARKYRLLEMVGKLGLKTSKALSKKPMPFSLFTLMLAAWFPPNMKPTTASIRVATSTFILDF